MAVSPAIPGPVSSCRLAVALCAGLREPVSAALWLAARGCVAFLPGSPWKAQGHPGRFWTLLLGVSSEQGETLGAALLNEPHGTCFPSAFPPLCGCGRAHPCLRGQHAMGLSRGHAGPGAPATFSRQSCVSADRNSGKTWS